MTFECENPCETTVNSTLANNPLLTGSVTAIPLQEPDDRYPGSFFRIPGMPTTGNTWSLSE
jgi:hypothetical protein